MKYMNTLFNLHTKYADYITHFFFKSIKNICFIITFHFEIIWCTVKIVPILLVDCEDRPVRAPTQHMEAAR